MVGLAGSELDAGKNVVALKERVVGENLLVTGPGAEEFQHVLHAQPLPANARPAVALARLNRDAVQELGFAHGGTIFRWQRSQQVVCGVHSLLWLTGVSLMGVLSVVAAALIVSQAESLRAPMQIILRLLFGSF